MSLRTGSLFSGYGGLDMAVNEVLGSETAWFVEYDKAPSKILAHHWPDVPNYGDITAVKWVPDCPTELGGCGHPAEVLDDKSGWQCNRCQMLWPISLGRVYWPEVPEPVDILTGGSPCQDLSHAGKRAGMTEGTRSNLWVAMREAIAQLRPGIVVWENVRGAYSACADSEMGSCPGCVDPGAPGGHDPWLRALGRVLGDLSDLGYDCRWHGLRAADVGAPHGRFRVFVVAHLAGDARWLQHGNSAATAVAENVGHEWAGASRGRRDGSQDGGLLPTPVARDWKGAGPADMNRHDPNLSAISALLPTPAVNDMGEGKTVEAWDEWTAKMQAAHGNGNGHGKSLSIEAQRLLPTPTSMDSRASGGNPETTGTHGTTLTDATVRNPQDWGIYADAIARWESLTRPAPAPTQPSKKGTPQLSPGFSEWMMGLPAGHVTDVPGLSRNDMLKALGNGVVPQQAAAALRFLLSVQAAAA